MQTRVSRCSAVALCLLALALSVPTAPAGAQVLQLSLGDPARKDREAPVVLDGVTDTKTGDLITPDDLAARLASTRLLLVGEEHTNSDFHRVQFRVIQALAKAGRHVMIGLEMYPYPEQKGLDQWRDDVLHPLLYRDGVHWYLVLHGDLLHPELLLARAADGGANTLADLTDGLALELGLKLGSEQFGSGGIALLHKFGDQGCGRFFQR